MLSTSLQRRDASVGCHPPPGIIIVDNEQAAWRPVSFSPCPRKEYSADDASSVVEAAEEGDAHDASYAQVP